MSLVRRLSRRLSSLIARARVERDMDDELAFHIDMATAEHVRRGMSPEVARTKALRTFGGLERVREDCRDARGVRLIEDSAQDIRYALRSLRKVPSFSAVVILTLALGIGASTAIFSVVEAVLLRPLPYGDSGRLVMVWETDRNSGTTREGASIPDYFDFIQRNRVFQQIAAFSERPAARTNTGGEPERLSAALVTGNFFATLRSSPLLGRSFRDTEDRPGGEPVALIGERYWRTRFSADQNVMGKTLVLDDRVHTIIGVMPGSLALPRAETDVWLPAQMGPTSGPRYNHSVTLIGRLSAGVPLARAQQEMTSIATQLETEYPRENAGRGVMLESLPDAIFGSVRLSMRVLLAAVGLVLLITCANVASLLLTRSATRRREVAVRTALGAGTMRLSRQFFIEGSLITLAATVLGILIAKLSVSALLSLAPADLPRLDGVGINLTVLAATLVVATVVAIGVGLVPTFEARRISVHNALKESGGRTGTAGRRQQRSRSLLVAAEIALCVVLVMTAALLTKSFWNLQKVDPGFRAHDVLRARLQLPASRYPQSFSDYPNWTRVAAFHRELIERVRILPGVTSVALSTNDPLQEGFTNSFLIEGREADAARGQAELATRIAGTTYFETAGIPLLRGRLPLEADDEDAPAVIVINEAAARRFFPGEDPIGKRLRFWGRWREIIGIVGNEKFAGLLADAPPAMYPPLRQNPTASVTLLLRTSVEPRRVLPAVQETIWSIDRDLPLYDIATMEEALAESVARQRFTMLVLGIFAGVAIALALVGIHGLLSYLVAQSTHEMGIRIALGAQPGNLMRRVLIRGVALAGAGIVVGTVIALASSSILTGLLFGVSPTDAGTYALVAVSVLSVATVASWLPTRRLQSLSPVVALREE